MTYVRTLETVRPDDDKWAGEKATRLGNLVQSGFRVPPGFVIGASAYADHTAQNGIGARIQTRLSELEMEDPVELEAAAEEIRSWIGQAPVPTAIQSEFSSLFGDLVGDRFAVRASRVIEDVVNPRASGLDQAFLGATRPMVFDNVRRIWATLWTSRAMYYRYHKKITSDQVSIAVLVQTMIDSSVAGVLFTADPLTGAADRMHIDATFGLGEAIVAARWKPDRFSIRKSDCAIISRDIVEKPLQVLMDPAGGIHIVPVEAEKQAVACITDKQVLALAEIGKSIEVQFKQPQDIEWCLAGDDIWILQARPLRKK